MENQMAISPYILKVNSSNPYRDNGGAVVGAGNINSASPITKDVTLRSTGKHYVFGSTLSDSMPYIDRATTAISSVANQVKGVYTMRYVTTALRSGSGKAVKHAIHYRESVKTRRVVTAGWNYATGQPLTTPTNATDSFRQDDEARSDRALPGEWVYTYGKTVSRKDYPART